MMFVIRFPGKESFNCGYRILGISWIRLWSTEQKAFLEEQNAGDSTWRIFCCQFRYACWLAFCDLQWVQCSFGFIVQCFFAGMGHCAFQNQLLREETSFPGQSGIEETILGETNYYLWMLNSYRTWDTLISCQPIDGFFRYLILAQ